MANKADTTDNQGQDDHILERRTDEQEQRLEPSPGTSVAPSQSAHEQVPRRRFLRNTVIGAGLLAFIPAGLALFRKAGETFGQSPQSAGHPEAYVICSVTICKCSAQFTCADTSCWRNYGLDWACLDSHTFQLCACASNCSQCQ